MDTLIDNLTNQVYDKNQEINGLKKSLEDTNAQLQAEHANLQKIKLEAERDKSRSTITNDEAHALNKELQIRLQHYKDKLKEMKLFYEVNITFIIINLFLIGTSGKSEESTSRSKTKIRRCCC